MKVMIVSANSLDPTGEAQYFRHLVAGMTELATAVDIEVHAYALNGRGNPLKYDVRPYPEEAIKYLSFKKFAEVANEMDYVIISTARFKGGYEWLEGLTTPYGLIVHSLPSVEAHKMAEIWSLENPPYINYVLDASIKEKITKAGVDPATIFFAGLPFSPRIMGPRPASLPAPSDEPYVIVPARIHFVKYPGDVAKLLIEAQEQVPDLVGVFFGADDFFYHTNLKELVEPCEFIERVDPYLDEDDKAKWWNWCTLAVDGTKLPAPPQRMQYTMLEAGYFGKPILVEEQRHSRLWNENISALPLSAENIVKVLQDYELRLNMVLANRAYVAEAHRASSIAMEILAPVVYGWRAS